MARSADELGMHSGWVSDHIAWPAHIESKYPYTDDGRFPAGNDMPWLDPVGTLFFVAAVTERLKLGVTVLILGYRPPDADRQGVRLPRRHDRAAGRCSASAWAGCGRSSRRWACRGTTGAPGPTSSSSCSRPCSAATRRPTRAATTRCPRSASAPARRGAAAGVGGRRHRAGVPPHGPFRRRLPRRLPEALRGGATPGSGSASCATRPAGTASELTLSIRLYLDDTGTMEAAKSIAGSAEQMADVAGQWARDRRRPHPPRPGRPRRLRRAASPRSSGS